MTITGLRLSLYGNIAIAKGFCKECGGTAFIRHNRFVCCGAPATEEPTKTVRECEPEQRRHLPPKRERDRLLAEQGHRCFYCDMPFNITRHRNGKPVGLKINWDHKLPWSATQNNSSANFVAACHVCNGIKSNLHFQTVDEARIALADKRREKGYDF